LGRTSELSRSERKRKTEKTQNYKAKHFFFLKIQFSSKNQKKRKNQTLEYFQETTKIPN
jgi:hypothetical protein